MRFNNIFKNILSSRLFKLSREKYKKIDFHAVLLIQNEFKLVSAKTRIIQIISIVSKGQ